MILVLKGRGGLAEGIARGLEAHGRAVALDLDVDIASMREVRRAVAERKPDAVVLAECWDDPDACEADPDRAFIWNAEAAIHLAAACLEFQAVPVLLSTPEVFGIKGGPWFESDEASPSSTWARTRLRGEQLLTRATNTALILRAGPILSDGLARERALFEAGAGASPIEEADDEWVTPVSAFDVGRAIHALLEAKASGLFHVAASEPPVSRLELYRAIATALGHGADVVVGQSGRLLSRRAARARAPALLAQKLARYLPAPILSWRTALDALDRPREDVKPAVEEKTTMGHRQTVRRVDKPWGHEIIWAQTDRYVGKILFVKAGERLSLQYHEKKDETVYVLSGKMVFEVGPKDKLREDLVMKAGDSYHITPHTTHRMIALEDTEILEASTPELDDVVRLEDKYGRAGTKAP